ncbi:Bgt-5364 [Blumeria graminis f. sp. tritici]|uniref:Bgt-5364 n=2 Tax=Blumeria graminis f. sp. tritici TaxID=62690 RepID=A0A9X9L9C4_BLUGR|nr:DNA helicase [Blumeria graminis f. sp. tritici 96224]VCU40088.1 Bgt-5364 [Blumeria graminis f. sp. tritici]
MASSNQLDGDIQNHLVSFAPTTSFPAVGSKTAETKYNATLLAPSSASSVNSNLRNFLPRPRFFESPSANIPKTPGGAPAFSASRWDPVSFLNARSFCPKPNDLSTNCEQNSKSSESSRAILPRMSFQFESAGQLYPSASSDTDNQLQDEKRQYETNGKVGNMLDHIYNVTTRDLAPQKRRKIHDDRLQNQAEVHFVAARELKLSPNSSGEQRREGSQNITTKDPQPTHISLIDDDDNIQVSVNHEMREVCYGRIEGAEIKAFKVPTPRPGAISISTDFWPQVRIVLRRRQGEKGNIIHAVDATRTIIGTIDVDTAVGLTPLLDSSYSIRTTSRILTRTRKEGDLPPGSDINACYALDLNLYGPKKLALNIGKHLSQKNLWLRTPLFVEAGVELYNPHAVQPPPPPARTLSSYIGHRMQAPSRTTEEIRNDVIGMFDTLQRSKHLPEMEPGPHIKTKLLKHQMQGLHFMFNKEKLDTEAIGKKDNVSLWKKVYTPDQQKMYINIITGQEETEVPKQVLGGILADMMGLGKTLLSLSLVVETLDTDAQEWAKLKPPLKNERQSPNQGRKTKSSAPNLEQALLVLNAKTTLLVSPLSTISNWEDQIKQHVRKGALSYYIYHGTNRIKDVEKLATYDLVITTYGSVASEFNNRIKKKNGSYPLEQINWFRVMLDEAHMIREQSTQQFKAICRLAANRRWAITGTPVQNRLEDLGALMSFLRIKPFDEKGGFAQHIMAPFKMCDPEILPKLRLLVDSITLRRLKDRIDLPPRHDHLVKLEFSEEERPVYDIFAKNAKDRIKAMVGQHESALSGKSYVHILQSILRLRLICAHGKDLLSDDDLKVMNGISKDSAIDLDSDGDGNDESSGLTQKEVYDMFNLMKQTNADVCLICAGKIGPSDTLDLDGDVKHGEVIGFMTPCYHIICTNCIKKYKFDIEEYSQGQPRINCPICQQNIKVSYSPLRKEGSNENEESTLKQKNLPRQGKCISGYRGPHTKTKALLEDLNLSRQESELLPSEPPIKSVVFSGWTAHLDLIQIALEENRFKFVRLDGKMSRTARSAAMDTFREDPSVLIILVSITAGGLGLNLTTANKVYIMEPQYNPAAESQAIDRVHRLGQKREVEAKRYIMKDSFEEKMLILQDKKKKLASLSMDGEKGRLDKAEAARKRLEDLRSLFK